MPTFSIDPVSAGPGVMAITLTTTGGGSTFSIGPVSVTDSAASSTALPTPPAVPTPAGAPTQWLIRSITPDNAHQADYSGVGVVASITWTLNSWEEAVFTIPLDVDVSELPLMDGTTSPRREVQILRNGVMQFQGVPVRRRVNAQARVWEYTAYGMLWFLSRRYVGRATPQTSDTSGLLFVNTEQKTIAQDLVLHAQGLGPYGSPDGVPNQKSDLRLHVRSETPSGVTRTRFYPYADHQSIFDALTELSQMNDGFDFDVDQNLAARTFRLWYPVIGTARSDIRFEWIRTLNETTGELEHSAVGIVDYDLQESIEDAANDITELAGWGDGLGGRAEAKYRDASLLADTTLELVESSPTDMGAADLATRAHGRALQLGKPQSIPSITLAEPRDPVTQEVVYPLIGVLKPGDTIKVLILDGAFTLVGSVFRIVQIRLDAQAETLACQITLPMGPTP